MTIIAALLLMLPVAYHLFDDRNGEKPEVKTGDIFIVTGIAFVAAVIGLFIANKPVTDGLLLAWGIHFFIFDYAINYILFKRGVIENPDWFGYLGQSYTDDVLRPFTPWQRLFMKISVLIVAIIIYVIQ